MDRSTIIGAIVLVGLTVYGYGRMLTSGRHEKRLRELIRSADIIDVRSSDEYRAKHFPGAMSIPVEKITKSGKRLGNKSKPLILYCSTGSRARKGARLLRMMGYSKVFVGGSLNQMEKNIG